MPFSSAIHNNPGIKWKPSGFLESRHRGEASEVCRRAQFLLHAQVGITILDLEQTSWERNDFFQGKGWKLRPFSLFNVIIRGGGDGDHRRERLTQAHENNTGNNFQFENFYIATQIMIKWSITIRHSKTESLSSSGNNQAVNTACKVCFPIGKEENSKGEDWENRISHFYYFSVCCHIKVSGVPNSPPSLTGNNWTVGPFPLAET